MGGGSGELARGSPCQGEVPRSGEGVFIGEKVIVLKRSVWRISGYYGSWLLAYWLSLSCIAAPPIQAVAIEYQVVNTYPHDPKLYTQGLEFFKGYLYESSGLYGHSKLVKYSRGLSSVNWVRRLPARYFAEGLSIVENTLYLLTWRSNRLLRFKAHNLDTIESKQGAFDYSGEGWGLVFNGEQFIRSDGSSQLFYHHRGDFSALATQEVTLNGKPLNRLNELEWVSSPEWGESLFANRLGEYRIYQIELESGAVMGTLDLRRLAAEQPEGAQVLNGIAWNKSKQTLLVTGKYWNKLYELKLSRP